MTVKEMIDYLQQLPAGNVVQVLTDYQSGSAQLRTVTEDIVTKAPSAGLFVVEPASL